MNCEEIIMSKICVLCKSQTDNEIDLGEILNTGKIYAHHYCLVTIVLFMNYSLLMRL